MAAHEIREKKTQKRTKLGLVLKHFTKGAEKVYALNYLTKLPPPVDEYYYEKDTYAVNDHTWGFRPKTQSFCNTLKTQDVFQSLT